jgi:ABC-2 type transport system permease protein
MSAYLAFAQSAFQTQLAYRNELWANIFGRLVQVFARVAIWLAVYAGASASTIGDVTLQQMVTYALIGGFSAIVRYELIISGIGNALKTGDVAVWLLKPVNFPLYIIVSELGRALFRLIALAVPTIAVVALVYGILPPASAFDGVMFVAYLVLANAILCLLSALFGLLAFWLLTSFSRSASICRLRGSSTTRRRCGWGGSSQGRRCSISASGLAGRRCSRSASRRCGGWHRRASWCREARRCTSSRSSRIWC